MTTLADDVLSNVHPGNCTLLPKISVRCTFLHQLTLLCALSTNVWVCWFYLGRKPGGYLGKSPQAWRRTSCQGNFQLLERSQKENWKWGCENKSRKMAVFREVELLLTVFLSRVFNLNILVLDGFFMLQPTEPCENASTLAFIPITEQSSPPSMSKA